MIEGRTYEQGTQSRIQSEKAAVNFSKLINDLWYDKGIETLLFRNQLIDKRTSEILNLHNYARKVVGKTINIEDTLSVVEAMNRMDLCPARLDIGKLASEWIEEADHFSSVDSFLTAKLRDHIGADNRKEVVPRDVVLYGFGRIGRLAARELIAMEGKGEQLRLRAIVTRDGSKETIEKRASLLRVDSVHGPFPGTVEPDEENDALIVNGRTIHLITAKGPEEIDYTAYGINNALIIDNTGAFRDDVALARHLTAKGAAKVLLTAPGKGVPNIVHGVNQLNFDPENVDIFSAASCT